MRISQARSDSIQAFLDRHYDSLTFDALLVVVAIFAAVLVRVALYAAGVA